MSIKYRHQRINKITSVWKLKKIHPLITSYNIPSSTFEIFKNNIKLYISKALHIKFNENESFDSNLNSQTDDEIEFEFEDDLD